MHAYERTREAPESHIMQTMVEAFSPTARTLSQPPAIHTTLYDIIATLHEEVAPEEEDLVTAAVVHLLDTCRATCAGDLDTWLSHYDAAARAL